MGNTKRVLSYLIFLALISGTALAVWQHRSILDWWQLRGYVPPAEIAALAADTAMTDPARRVFYVNHPDLMDDSTAFRQACPLNEETIILGCYHSGQRGIFIFDVDSTELDGVEEVTAAHEMLHAAYERLSANDKSEVEALLTSYYQNELTNERIKKSIDNYRKTEPNQLLDEMHSIFGTEVANLPAELETYYSRYFTDRGRVVALSASYEQEFTNRLNAINAADARLADLKRQIDNAEAALKIQSAEIERDQQQLDQFRESGNTSAYNAAVPAFNAKVAAYNQALNSLKADIAEYNRLVEERNATADELRALNTAIDTRLEPQTRQ